ncbi:hypothetical protein AKJ16_DCAP27184 [Drosera capensis]
MKLEKEKTTESKALLLALSESLAISQTKAASNSYKYEISRQVYLGSNLGSHSVDKDIALKEVCHEDLGGEIVQVDDAACHVEYGNQDDAITAVPLDYRDNCLSNIFDCFGISVWIFDIMQERSRFTQDFH